MEGLSVKTSKKKSAPRRKKNRLPKADRSAVHLGLAGGMEVLGMAGSALVVIILLFMLTRLASWVRGDLNMLFADMNSGISGTVLIYNR